MISIITLVIISTNTPITLIVMIIASLSEVVDERKKGVSNMYYTVDVQEYLIYIPLFEAGVRREGVLERIVTVKTFTGMSDEALFFEIRDARRGVVEGMILREVRRGVLEGVILGEMRGGVLAGVITVEREMHTGLHIIY